MAEKIDDVQVSNIVEDDLQPDTNDNPLNLHAMRFSELLDTTLSLYCRHFRSFLGIASGYFIAILIWASVLYLNDSVGRTTRIVIWIPTVIILFSGFVFVVSGLISASAQAYLFGTIKTSVALRQAIRHFLPCFVSLLLFGLLAILLTLALSVSFKVLYESLGGNSFSSLLFGGTVMLILIWVAGCSVTYWCFFASTVLVEGKPIRMSLRRCRDLIRGTWWRVTGIVLSIFLLTFAIGSILRVTLGFLMTLTGLADAEFTKIVRMGLWDVPTGWRGLSFTHVLMFLLNLGVDTFTLPVWVVGATLLHFDQRIRKEGFDIEMRVTRQGSWKKD